MNLKKLSDLDNKQNTKLSALVEEHKRTLAQCDALKEKLPQILIDKGQEDADKVAADLTKLTNIADAQEVAINQLEQKGYYYTDDDVIDGFMDYAKEYNSQFRKLHSSYIKCLDEAFSVYKKMVELRRSGKGMREDFKYYLADKSLMDGITLDTLDRKNKSSKDSVPNFISYYGDPNTYETMQKVNEDSSVFSDL